MNFKLSGWPTSDIGAKYTLPTITRFPGGEIHVAVPPMRGFPKFVTVHADLRSSDDVMTLVLLMDAIHRQYPTLLVDLTIPYLPYARQDRVCNPGEALSLRVMTDIINRLGHRTLTVWDVHSDTALALLDRVYNLPAATFLLNAFNNAALGLRKEQSVLVSPDAGAIKRVSQCAKYIGLPMVRADKTRDPNGGNITGTVLYADHIGNRDFVIVDDICDGGRTFVNLADQLRRKTNGKVILYVTHGIFSAGLGVFDGLIDQIICANSFIKLDHPKLHVLGA